MILVENDLEVDFTDALNATKFDDGSHALSHCMKAVDFVIELQNAYLFIEIKDPSNPEAIPENVAVFKEKTINGKLCGDIVTKFRDSFLYRWAENKLEKPVHFLSLITLEEALLNNLQDELRKRLPFIGPSRWARKIAVSCHIINIDTWNRNFPKWPVRRISGTA